MECITDYVTDINLNLNIITYGSRLLTGAFLCNRNKSSFVNTVPEALNISRH